MMTVILTGGQSRRMGRDKALVELEGEAMSLRLARRFEELGPVAFCVDRRGRFPVGPYRELCDKFPGQGPLNGLVAAFEDGEEDTVLLIATDMPNLSPAAARKLFSAIGDHDACIFRGEPLFGLYRRNCGRIARSCLEDGKRSFRDFLPLLDVLRLEPTEEGLFQNLNTPEELENFKTT